MKILLIGDLCIDCFINVDCERISPERPVAVVTPHSINSNEGMAGNVAANIRSLGINIELTTLYPAQPSTKTRYVDRASNQHFLRVDQNVQSQPLDARTFIDALESHKWDAVVMSSYDKGFLPPSTMQAIAQMCQARDIPTFCDTKALLSDWSNLVTVIKINAKEYAAQLAAGIKDPYAKCQNLIVTRGGDGMDLMNQSGEVIYKTKRNEVQVVDVVGCGDTTHAALVIGYLETRDLKLAMDFAGKASAIAASKRGVVAVKREEVVCP